MRGNYTSTLVLPAGGWLWVPERFYEIGGVSTLDLSITGCTGISRITVRRCAEPTRLCCRRCRCCEVSLNCS